MPFTPSFYSQLGETAEVTIVRVFHNNSACHAAQGIANPDRMPSTGGHRMCPDCLKLNTQEGASRW
ncbi:MAG: hypothetical protein GEU75_13525 [Dehalococcoidia bacterium]|nr:hypothetical protein [Dehalococcoidia bacterium]